MGGARARAVSRSWRAGAALLALAALPPLTVRAQESCETSLRSAAELYDQGQFDAARDAIKACLGGGARRAAKVQAYALWPGSARARRRARRRGRAQEAARHRSRVPAGAVRRAPLRAAGGRCEAQAADPGRQLGLEVDRELARGPGQRRRHHRSRDRAPRLPGHRGRAPRSARLRLLQARRGGLLEHLPARLPFDRDKSHAGPPRRRRGERPLLQRRLDLAAIRPQQRRQDRGHLRPGLDHVRCERLCRRRQHHHQGPEGAGGGGQAAGRGRPADGRQLEHGLGRRHRGRPERERRSSPGR